MRAQLLDASRPVSVVDVVRRLMSVQVYPYASIAPSADLVLWSRLGSRYEPADLQRELEVERTLVEFAGMIWPMEDIALFRAHMARAPHYAKTREWLELNADFREDVLSELYDRGPIGSREIPDTARFPWPSTGWTNNRNVTQMLEVLMACGDVAISGHEDGQRLWDLAERIYPEVVVEVPLEEAWITRGDRRLRSLGVALTKGPRQPGEPKGLPLPGLPATVEGSDAAWRVHPGVLPWLDDDFDGRTVLLSPLDRLVFDRDRALGIFGFEYVVEMYKPKAKRRWGYFALPILHHHRLVGKLDATDDRVGSVLTVNAIHEDEPFSTETREAVHHEIRDLARWLGLRVEGL